MGKLNPEQIHQKCQAILFSLKHVPKDVHRAIPPLWFLNKYTILERRKHTQPILVELLTWACIVECLGKKRMPRAGMAQRWQRSPPTNVARIRFQSGVICGLSLLLVLALPRRFFSGISVFPQSAKHNTPNSRFARCRHLTATTRIPFVFSLLFKF